MSINVEKIAEQSMVNGKFNKEKFAELVIGKCVGVVLNLEMSKSGFIASVIEEKMGLEQGYFSDEWFEENQKVL
jgi:flagellar biosynthesis protein FliR